MSAFGRKQTSSSALHMSAFDPERTFGVKDFRISSVLFRVRCMFSKVLPFANFYEGYRMTRLRVHPEHHLVGRIGWLRAAVLGANDGIVSTASLIVGVAAAATTPNAVLIAGVAGLVAGAMFQIGQTLCKSVKARK